MKIRPVILCGGSGTRLWPDKKNHQPKQFIDFGNWTLFGKTLDRVKHSIFDYPIISTNKKYITEQDLEPEIGTVIPTIKLASINTGTGDLFPLVWALVDDM